MSDHPHHLSHQHDHVHNHEHGHDHAQVPSHSHKHNSMMSGETYWRWPGLRETALKNANTIIWALQQSGLSKAEIAKMDLLEVGCGEQLIPPFWRAAALTKLLAPSFAHVHAIDIEPSMITSLHSRLPSDILMNPTESASSVSHGNGNVLATTHLITSSSPTQFSDRTSQPSPTTSDPQRTLAPVKERFDIAVMVNVLHHVENQTELFTGLKGLLKENGKLVVIEPNGLKTVEPSGEHVKMELENGEEVLDAETLHKMMSHGAHHHDFLNLDQLVQLFSQKGFTVSLAEIHGTMPTQGVGRKEMELAVLVVQKA